MSGHEAKRKRTERGQTLLEFALIVPLLVIMVAFAIDAGRFIMYNASVNAAADALAREVEAAPAMTEAQALEFVKDAYPELAGSCDVTLGSVGKESKTIQQHLRNHVTGDVEGRASIVQTESHPVRVEYTGTWATPGLILISNHSGDDGTFRVASDAVGIIDTTIDTW